jgi:hypothetical protein
MGLDRAHTLGGVFVAEIVDVMGFASQKYRSLAETAVGVVDGGGVGSPPTLAGAIAPVP